MEGEGVILAGEDAVEKGEVTQNERKERTSLLLFHE